MTNAQNDQAIKTLFFPHFLANAAKGNANTIVGVIHYVRSFNGDNMSQSLCGVKPGIKSMGWHTTGRPVTCQTCLAKQQATYGVVYGFGINGRLEDKTNAGMWEAYDARKPHIRLVVSLRDSKLNDKLIHFFGRI